MDTLHVRGGIVPGIHDDAHRRAFLAGRARFFAAGGPRRCAALAKHGGPCQAFALRGHEHCSHHAPNRVRHSRRLRLLSRPKTAAQAERARRREHARILRIIWRRDRHAPGATVTLGPREGAFVTDLQALGFDPASCSPATMDAARWLWIGVQSGRTVADQMRERVRWHIARDTVGA
jgi:hypothetical protein